MSKTKNKGNRAPQGERHFFLQWRVMAFVLAAYDAGEPFTNMKGPRIPKGKTKEECRRALDFDARIWEFENKWAKIR